MYFLFRFCYFLSALRFAFSFRPPPSATIIDAVRTVYYYRLSFVIIFLCTSFFRSFCVVLCGRLLVFCHDFISIFNFLSVGTQNKNNKITKTKKKKHAQINALSCTLFLRPFVVHTVRHSDAFRLWTRAEDLEHKTSSAEFENETIRYTFRATVDWTLHFCIADRSVSVVVDALLLAEVMPSTASSARSKHSSFNLRLITK